MNINYLNIVLRDMEEKDIADEIRWHTTETEWALWDAPWEMEEALRSFDRAKHRAEELEWLAREKPDHRLSFEIDTWEGVHIGSVNSYRIDENYDWQKLTGEEDRTKVRWALGIEINESSFWSSGWGTQALTALVKYHLAAGYEELYTQTWSGNERMIRLAEKLGFRECCRKRDLRLVRGERYDGLTFRLDRAAFHAHCRRLEKDSVELYIPRVEDMWFTQRMQTDPATMAYNAGWDVDFDGYHPDTGCIDFPPEKWEEKHRRLVGREPEQFYAFVRDKRTGAFLGEVNHHDAGGSHEIGVVLYAPCRGRGYGLAALELLLERAFLVDKVDALTNTFEPDRDPGLAIHEKAGFRVVGEDSMVRFGKDTRLLVLELTRREYLKKQ